MSRVLITPGEHASSPSFFDKTWCDQGHMIPIGAPCPVCQNTMAVIASDLLKQLDLGQLEALEGELFWLHEGRY